MINSSITFAVKGKHRHITFDDPKSIEMLDSGSVRIKCRDGFYTVISEWDSFEVDRWENQKEEEYGFR